MSSTTKFDFTSTHKRNFIILFVIGMMAVLTGVFTGQADAQKTWANLLVNAVFFTGLSALAVFFLAAHQIAFAGWHALVKRVPEAMTSFLWIGAICILVVTGGTIGNYNNLYHWSDTFLIKEKVTMAELEAYEKEHAHGHEMEGDHESGEHHGEEHSMLSNGTVVLASAGSEGGESGMIDNPYYDEILDGKSAYLNDAFFMTRTSIYLVLWVFIGYQLRRFSIKEEETGEKMWFQKTRTWAAVFLVVWAVSSSMMAWDWVMSLDPHWYSTLFGWYNFISLWVASLSVVILLIIYLKRNGYMPQTNENHLHDLGKYIFGFSVFWTYLWFSQFMLIWYGNIPEETAWFLERKREYNFLFGANLAVNFLVPFLVLMRRDAKRNFTVLTVVASLLIVFHWVDFYLMIIPSTVHGAAPIGYFEIGMALAFAGVFLYSTFRALSKVSLVPQHNPFIQESIEHHI